MRYLALFKVTHHRATRCGGFVTHLLAFDRTGPISCHLEVFKGDGDPLTLKDLNLILMRAWAIGAMDFEEIATADLSLFPPLHPALLAHERYQLPSQRTVTIISVKRPDKLLNDLSGELRFRPTDEPGIYLCEQLFPIRIICPRELSLQPKNYPLLPLAKGKKLEQFIDICLRDGLTTYLQLIIDIGLATDPEMMRQPLLAGKNSWRLAT